MTAMFSRTVPRVCLMALACAVLVTPAAADDWPGFHGPDSQGKVAGALPDSWDDSDYLWRVELPGTDVGSMAVSAGRVFLLSYDADRSALALLALNTSDGAEQWRQWLPIGQYHRHKRNTYASSTPTVHGDSVYIAYADADHTWLRCFSLQGTERWSRDFGPWLSDHGFGTSPRVAGGMVLLYDSQQAEQLEPGQEPSHERIIAVDAQTGADLWKAPLKPTRTNYGMPAYFEPPSGTPQVIAAGTGNGLFGLDATSGEMLWELPVFNKRSVSTPLVVEGIAIGSCGSGGGGNYLVGVRIPTVLGEQPEELYRIDRAAAYVPTSAVDGDYLMMVSDNGIVSRLGWADGELVWQQRLGGNFGASPIVIGDKALLVSLDGIASVIASSNDYRKLGEVDLGAGVGATPAVGDGKLLLRVGDELRCLSVQPAD